MKLEAKARLEATTDAERIPLFVSVAKEFRPAINKCLVDAGLPELAWRPGANSSLLNDGKRIFTFSSTPLKLPFAKGKLVFAPLLRQGFKVSQPHNGHYTFSKVQHVGNEYAKVEFSVDPKSPYGAFAQVSVTFSPSGFKS